MKNIKYSKFKKQSLFGIKETKEVLVALIDLMNTVDEAQSDGWDIGDALKFIEPLTKLPAAIMGNENIPSEIKDMDEAEYAELVAEIEKLDFASQYSEEIAEQSVVIILHFVKLLEAIRKSKAQK